MQPQRTQTNIVMFESPTDVSVNEFMRQLDTHGIRFSYRGGLKFRAVTHLMVGEADTDEVLERIGLLVRELG